MAILSVKASQIENWTEREPRRAQEILPKLVWKLVLASSKKIEDIHFPFEGAIQYAGYDGYLITADDSPFYPNGTSVWEFGTDENIKSKINSDYKKRSENPNGIDTHATAFCFVTSRIWNHREGIAEFTNNKQKEGVWKNVRILDANSIELWLNECPSVAAWFSRVIDEPFDDVMSLQDYWDYTVSQTVPKLTPEFFCCGRDKSIADDIIKKINSGCSQIILSAESKEEAVLALTADLLNKTNLQSKQIVSKILVALSSNGLRNACRSFQNAIIIPAFKNDSIPLINENTIILPVENNSPIDLLYKNSPKCKIEPRRRLAFVEALETLGFDVNEANRIADDSKCRFSPLFRRITNDINYKLPSWTANDNIGNLLPALLANAWEGTLEGDRVALEILSGKEYGAYISSIEEYTNGDNMPIFRLDQSFACVSINELWDILARNINSTIFENYKKCIEYVFAETDPTYELPEEKWYVSSLYGRSSKFSGRLKQGLIISMTKIVELDEKEGLFHFSTSCTAECNSIVFGIYNGVNSINQWRTLAPYMDDFVEATPETILSIIESKVTNDSDEFWRLFDSSNSPIFGRTFYTHILWSLEKLIWLKEFNIRAINVLITLDEKNFEYSISNCPLDSLMKVFCLWYHQGALSKDERDTVLANVIENHHTTGRKLINKLLPEGGSTITSLSEFKWRYVEYSDSQVTTDQLSDSVKRIAKTYVKIIDSNFKDWEIVINHFTTFYYAFLELEIDIAQKAAELSESDRLKLCALITFDISRGRKYLDKKNTEKNTTVNEMEKVYKSILPDSPLKYAPYYSYDFHGFNPVPYDSGEYDYDRESETLKEIRINALEETLDSFGIGSILPLAQNVEELSFLIDSFVNSKYFEQIDFDFIIKAHSVFPQFAESLISSIYNTKGIVYYGDMAKVVPESDLKWIVGQLPMTPDVVGFINSFEESVQSEFWQCASTWGIMRFEKSFSMSCINSLLEHQRPYSAIKAMYSVDWINIDLVLDVLQAALEYYPNTERSGVNLSSLDSYYVEKMFETIYKGHTEDIIRVSQLEFAFMNVFSFDFEPKCLIDSALANSSVFLELLSYCFKKDDNQNDEKTEKEINIAHLAYKVLDRIKRLPGQTNEGVDIEKFNLWIQSVLNLAKEKKLETACNEQIGRILSYSPIGEDGIWPHKCVRDFLEKNTSETINSSIRIGRINQRGIYNVTGGDEEERIAATYNDFAQKLQLIYPKTSLVVKSISDDYKHQSRYEKARELKGYF